MTGMSDEEMRAWLDEPDPSEVELTAEEVAERILNPNHAPLTRQTKSQED